MDIDERPVGTIRPYDNNPRHNDAGVDAVAASIMTFGFRQPIVVDEQDVIIVGHTRYRAALKLGLATVPVHVARGLTPAQARAYRIADNQTANLSSWDDDKLPLELMALQDAGFDVSLTGFSADELQAILAPAPLAKATPTRCQSRRWSPSRNPVTCGNSAGIGCSAAMPRRPRTWAG